MVSRRGICGPFVVPLLAVLAAAGVAGPAHEPRVRPGMAPVGWAGETPTGWSADTVGSSAPGPAGAPRSTGPTPGPSRTGSVLGPVAGAGAGGVAVVSASTETVVMPGASGDVADDVAIWRNDQHPEQSLILGDNKAESGGGVAVYRLDGSLAHYEPAGQIGNIDLRLAGVGGQAVILVGANDRQHTTVRFWALDPATARLTGLEAREVPTGMANYGFCLGRDTSGAHTYGFVTAYDSGRLEQYELWAHDGRVDAALVRVVDVGSVAEGCAVDDVTGALYVAEESTGVWRYDVDPATGDRRTAVDRTGTGHLVADVEGVSVVRGRDRRGYLLVSSQGDSAVAVYDADDQHAFRGRFSVTDSAGVDGATGTDGLEAAAGDFGPAFPQGLLVLHDEDNRTSDGTAPASNLKLVRLDQVLDLTP